MKSMIAIAALIGVAFAASSAFAQSGAPGTTPSKPNKVTAVPPPPPPGGPDKLVTRPQPPVPPGPRKPTGPIVVDDIAGHPNQAHADLPPGPGTYNCASEHACIWLASKCAKADGGMSQNPPDKPGGFPTQTCTIQ